MRSEAERFWEKVNFFGPVHPTLGTRCWLWTAYLKPNGYGGFRVKRGGKWVMGYAHRVVWDIAGKPLKPGQQSLHQCDNPACVNYKQHLIQGTQSENLLHAGSKMWRDVRGTKNPNFRHGRRTKVLTAASDASIIESGLDLTKGKG
jgi:hypothetical protein